MTNRCNFPFGLKSSLVILAAIFFGLLLYLAPPQHHNNHSSSSNPLSVEKQQIHLILGTGVALSTLAFFFMIIGLLACSTNALIGKASQPEVNSADVRLSMCQLQARAVEHV